MHTQNKRYHTGWHYQSPQYTKVYPLLNMPKESSICPVNLTPDYQENKIYIMFHTVLYRYIFFSLSSNSWGLGTLYTFNFHKANVRRRVFSTIVSKSGSSMSVWHLKQPPATRKQNLLGLMISPPQGHYYLINSPLERNTQPKGNQVTDIDFQPVNKV